MDTYPGTLFRDALALPAAARSALLDSLIESLDFEMDAVLDEGASDAWRREIELRLQQIDNGTVDLIPWNEARRSLRARLGR